MATTGNKTYHTRVLALHHYVINRVRHVEGSKAVQLEHLCLHLFLGRVALLGMIHTDVRRWLQVMRQLWGCHQRDSRVEA